MPKAPSDKDPTNKSSMPPWTAFLLPFLDIQTPEDNLFNAALYKGVAKQTREIIYAKKNADHKKSQK